MPALYDESGMLTWRQLVDHVNQVANQLIAAGLQPGDTVTGLSENNARYLTLFLGTLAAGGCMVPLSGMASGDTLALMINDCDARFLFVSDKHRTLIDPLLGELTNIPQDHRFSLDFQAPEWRAFDDWMADADTRAPNHHPQPDDPFNIIYSSGTTGVPKGILHDHRMRARQLERVTDLGYDPQAVTLVSTPLYSNTTLGVRAAHPVRRWHPDHHGQIPQPALPGTGRTTPRYPYHVGAGAVSTAAG